MTAPIPAKVTNLVLDQMGDAILVARRFLDSTDTAIQAWEAQIDKVFIKFPAESLACYATLAHLQGDATAAERYFDRALKNGADPLGVAYGRLALYCNLNFASSGLPVVREVVDIKHLNIGENISKAVSLGAVAHVEKLLAQASAADLDLNGVEQIETIRQIARELSGSGVTDEEFAAAIDLVGTILRGRRLFWLDEQPRYIFDRGTGCMGVRYKVDVTPQEAAAMNLELTDLLIEKNLGHLPITLGFIGVAAV